MRMTPSLELGLALGSAGLMGVAIVWYVITEIPTIQPGQPTWKGEAVVDVSAAVPTIGPFEREFHVNNEDPFLPYTLRQIVDSIASRLPDRGPRRGPVAVVPPPPPPPRPPEIHWPAAAVRPPGPTCIGLITTSAGSLLLAHMPGSDEIVGLSTGDAIPMASGAGPQWTLVGVGSDGLARFRDPFGSEVLFPIGAPPSDPPPSADDGGGTSSSTTPKNGSGPQLPPNFSPGNLKLPPNWQSQIPPGMQKEVQQQIMQQIMHMQAQQGGGK